MDLAKGSTKRRQWEQRSQSASLHSRLGTAACFNTSASVYGLSFPGQATISLSFPGQATISLSFPGQATNGPLGFPYKATSRDIACSSEYRSVSRSKARLSDRG